MQNNTRILRWLKEGKKRFAKEGIKGINIKEMSKSLGVAKTSFYHHFKSRDEYFKSLLEYWVEDGTLQIMNKVAIIENPYDRISKLTELAFNNIENDKFLFHLRSYSQKDKYAASVLKKLENNRLKFLTKIFTEMNCSISEARKKAKTYYMYYLGFFEFHKFNGISNRLIKETINEMNILFDIKE
jgi:AcrR family transcriptional regulator